MTYTLLIVISGLAIAAGLVIWLVIWRWRRVDPDRGGEGYTPIPGVVVPPYRGEDRIGVDAEDAWLLGFAAPHAVRPGLDDEARRPRLRQPGAVELTVLEQGERLRVLGRRDLHVAAARHIRLQTLRRQPGAQRDVLGVAELRGRQGLALEVGGAGDAVAHHERRAAAGGARDHAHRGAARLDERVDRRVRADVGGVDGSCRERLDGGGAGVEDLGLELRRAELLLQVALLHADEGRGVRDRGEVAEAKRVDLLA